MIRKSIPKKFRFSLVIFLLASSVFILLFVALPSVHASITSVSGQPLRITHPAPLTTISTPGASNAIASNSERKLLYANGYWWAFWLVSGGVNYSSSSSGTTWSTPASLSTSANGVSSGVSVWLYGSNTLYYIISSGGSLSSFVFGQATLNAGTISTPTETTVATTHTTGSEVSIITDSSGNIWAGVASFSAPNIYVEVLEYYSSSWHSIDVITSSTTYISAENALVSLVPLGSSIGVVYSFEPEGNYSPIEILTITGGGAASSATQVAENFARFSATSIGSAIYISGSDFDQTLLQTNATFFSYTGGVVSSLTNFTTSTSGFATYPTSISATNGNALVVFYTIGLNLYYVSSTDGGTTWSSQQSLASVGTSLEDISAEFSSSSNTVGVMYLDYEGGSPGQFLDFATVTAGSSTTTTSTTLTTTSTSSSTSTSTSYTSSTTSSTSTSTVPTRAHVSITLNPFLPSNAISANNYFLVTYNDGAQESTPQQGGTLQIIADIGSTISIAAASSGSNAAEQWCLSATSGGTCQPTTILVGASGVSVTYVYYDIQLQFVGYEISGGGTPIAPYFGVYATAPLVVTSSPSARDATITSLPLSATSYASIWLLAGTVALFEPIINTNPTAASQQWLGVPACDILFVGAISCGNYVSDYQVGPFSQGGVFVTIDYHHQYSHQVLFSVIGSGTGYSAPTLNYVSAGSSQLLTLTLSASSLFLDAGSSWSVTPNPLAGSTPTNNWIALSGTSGTITGPGTIDPVYAKSIPGQIPANLQESFGVSDTLVPSPQTPLSDSVSISDKYVPPSSAALVDVITLEDKYIAPLTAPLFDSVAVNDYFVSPIVTALNDLVGVGEKLTSSPFLAARGTFSGTIMFTVHSPVNILVTDTLGKQAGFNSTGSMINTIPGAQIIPKNGTQLETIIIPNPLSGQYTVEVFPVNGGGNYTIELQSTNANGTVVTDTHQTGSITSGTQYLGVTLSSAGQVNETPPSSTPPFRSNSSYMIIIIIAIAAVAVAALGSSLFIWRRRRR